MAMGIEGEQIILEPMSLKFVSDTYLHWLKDPEVTQYMASSNYSMEQLKSYVSERIDNPNVVFWAILDRWSREHIGNVKLEPIDKKIGYGTFGIMLGAKNFWGRGIATETARLVSSYAFEKLGLKRINLAVHEANVSAIKAYSKIGFTIKKKDEHSIHMVMQKVASQNV